MVPGPLFGSKDDFSGLAIIVDTSQKVSYPSKQNYAYISAVINNGSLNYDHFMDRYQQKFGGCGFNSLRNMDHHIVMTVR